MTQDVSCATIILICIQYIIQGPHSVLTLGSAHWQIFLCAPPYLCIMMVVSLPLCLNVCLKTSLNATLHHLLDKISPNHFTHFLQESTNLSTKNYYNFAFKLGTQADALLLSYLPSSKWNLKGNFRLKQFIINLLKLKLIVLRSFNVEISNVRVHALWMQRKYRYLCLVHFFWFFLCHTGWKSPHPDTNL